MSWWLISSSNHDDGSWLGRVGYPDRDPIEIRVPHGTPTNLELDRLARLARGAVPGPPRTGTVGQSD